MNYQEKQDYKLNRYQELQAKAQQNSTSEYEKSNRLSEGIPFGQPILIGHHSEKRHRRDIERIHNAMDNSIKEQEKAEYYKNKIDNLLNPSSISSDNPEALKLLQEKLSGLEAIRERYKERNKKARTENKEQIPSYALSNLGQNIRSVKERIIQLQATQNIQATEKTINGITLKTEDNRVKLFFPTIPTEEKRTELKRNGFKWSPFNKCWQRLLNNRALYVAEQIISEVD